MRKYNKLNMRKVVILSALFFAVSCKKKDNFVGANLQGDKLGVNVIDTLSLLAYTTKQDSIKADELSISTLGSYVDPVFGNTSASIYTQLRLSADNVNFAPTGTSADIEIDSVVLAFEIFDHYGTLEPQTFEVYKITEDLIKDSTYYSNRTFLDDGLDLVEVGSSVITPDPNNKVFVDGDSLNPQLRIRIDKSFGQQIVDESGSSNLTNNDNFLQFIKGVYIKTNNAFASGQGAILSLDLLSANSKMTIYYRDTVLDDTASFDLLINENNERVNNIVHDYSGTMVQNQLNDSTLGVNETYIQGVQGVKTQVEIPNLLNLKDSNIIINKAVLSLPVDYTSGAYTPNDQLLILRNEDGEQLFIADQLTYGLAVVGGKWNEDNSSYEFVITRYINNILKETYPNNMLSIETASSMVTPNRAVLFGTGSANKPKLTLTYTKY